VKAKPKIKIDLANLRGHGSFLAVTTWISRMQDVIEGKLEPFQIRCRLELTASCSRFQSIEDGNQIPYDSRLGGIEPEKVDIVEKVTLVEKHGVFKIKKNDPAVPACCNFSNGLIDLPRVSAKNKGEIKKFRLSFCGFVGLKPRKFLKGIPPRRLQHPVNCQTVRAEPLEDCPHLFELGDFLDNRI
jgi:hypothetical protein